MWPTSVGHIRLARDGPRGKRLAMRPSGHACAYISGPKEERNISRRLTAAIVFTRARTKVRAFSIAVRRS
jgi:hypothetical protein